ncbi:MAG: HIT domain-containing protein [Planctomycetales bacterium]|nr:HIT domain-containing protein [Planctomycetales bacterium]
MSEKTVFKKIIDGEIPAEVVYEDELCLAFRDIDPQAPTHVLVIPRQEIPSLTQITDDDVPLLGHLCKVARDVAVRCNLEEGYRVVINSGPQGGQDVPHLHLHLLGGRPLTWPPG